MTETLSLKKTAQLKDAVYDILSKNRITEESKTKESHRSYGLFQGKFALDKSQRKLFNAAYIKAISKGVNDLSILEVQKEYAPIIVDIDLEMPSENYKSGRLYDNEMILNIIGKYVESINTYLDVSKDNFKICLLEKEKPTLKDGNCKDGFHLMFPNLCVQTQMRHLIRYKVVKMCEEEGLFKHFLNGPDKIIDKAVVSSNAWFLYGSRKPAGNAYSLIKIYNDKLQVLHDCKKRISIDCKTGEETEEYYDDKTIIKYLSLQNTKLSKKYATPLNDDFANSDINAECEKLGINSTVKAEQVKYIIPANKESDIHKATTFTGLLNEVRASNYNDWLRVGLALHGIDDSLIYTWIEFSKKCGKKFEEGKCEKLWKTMKTSTSGNILTIRSLAYWAKEDDPKQYQAFIKQEFKNLMSKSLDGSIYNLAKCVHAKYCDRFVCSAIKTNTWWEFRHHRWSRIEEGYTLKLLLSEEFANEYHLELGEISVQITQAEDFAKQILLSKQANTKKIIDKLMNTSNKNILMDECRSLFYDKTFEQKLDSNIHLLGFENGIYDLENSVFRDGRPDDYITLSTRNNYYKWNESNPLNEAVMTFFAQILPNEKVRNYFINALCTCLSGETKEEKLYIMSGSGSNGKSLTMDLMYHALGDYYMTCPITIITRKRGQSNETSPEKVRMKGRRCGVFQETDDGEKLNVGIMKEFTGGDKILVRDLFKGANDMIEFKPQMKLFLTCNQLPPVPSNDDGTWRRLRVIEFGSKFTDTPTKPNEFKIDTMLKQKIEQWAPCVISYLLHIFNTQYKNKTYLTEPDEVLEYTKSYKASNDYYTEYKLEKLNITGNPQNTIHSIALYDDFRTWYKSRYDPKSTPKKPDFCKFISNQPDIGKANKSDYFPNITFKMIMPNQEVITNSNLDE